MTKRLTNFRIDQELLEGLESIRKRDPDWGVSRQVREAIKDWLEKNGVTVKTGPRRARTRRKALRKVLTEH
jgi:hypothetical protein